MRTHMTLPACEYKIEPVLYKRKYPQTSDGEGFWDTIFYIENLGSSIDASTISMNVEIAGKSYPLAFATGVSILKKGSRMEYNAVPEPLRSGSVGVIVLKDQKENEIGRSPVRIIRHNETD
jgi:hypothetical protein